MPPEPSLRALARDLTGDLVDERPSLSEALARCPRGQNTVLPAHDQGRKVALVVLASGGAYTVPDECPHDGGTLSDGFVDGDRLVCARHGWELAVCAGVCVSRIS